MRSLAHSKPLTMSTILSGLHSLTSAVFIMGSGARLPHAVAVLIMMKWFAMSAILGVNVTNITELELKRVTPVRGRSTANSPNTIVNELPSSSATLRSQGNETTDISRRTAFVPGALSAPLAVLPRITSVNLSRMRQRALSITTASTPPCTNVTVLVAVDRDGGNVLVKRR